MNRPVSHLLCLASLVFQITSADAGAADCVMKEYEKEFTTYPYSDADPVPVMSRFYPYFRYDGFTNKPVQKKWKVVELSNEYVQVLILPEIGGKVWTAIDKTTGKVFLYDNHVVKFRDISMRGPWTSGGIEPNYGIFGHTPNCFSPVDYTTRREADGSVTCTIGALDLLTRSTWRLEVKVAPKQAFFTTRSLWHNASGMEQPYYTWMNVGIKSAGNLQFINPGTNYIGHDGDAHPWPVDEKGREIAWYEKNNFGSYKSYHVAGRLSEFFGGYWHDEDFGVAHYAPYADKTGRKIWIWGLSREGMIWEKLLTDSDGQYVEIQSGRLFNQAAPGSTQSPFKHTEFSPYATDTWTEHWMPVKGTKGFVSASPWGAMNVVRDGEKLTVSISPVQVLEDKIEIFDGDHLLATKEVHLKPMKTVEERFTLTVPAKALRVCVGGDKLRYVASDEDVLSRPMSSPANFDWGSLYGLYLKGKEFTRQREYGQAEEQLRACLKLDANYVPALVEMAFLANRRGDFSGALALAKHALSIDTYDPAANYQFGRASVALGHAADAKESFSIAALAPGGRSAANTELAKQFFREKRYDRAIAAAKEGVAANARNLDALQIIACALRIKGDTAGAESTLRTLLEIDPLNHFARYEKTAGKKGSAKDFTSQIRNELPHETFLELAVWYHGVGLDGDAGKILELAPPSTEALYWLAYVRRDTAALDNANAASPESVFPFRMESIAVFEWAAKQSAGWQSNYFLALIHWHLGDLAKARELLSGCGDKPAFAPFYATRAQVIEGSAAKDLQRAAQLDPKQWRYGAMLARHHLQHDDAAAALAVATDYTTRFPTNDTLTLLRAKALLLTGKYKETAAMLTALQVLPSEGTTEARSLLREANLLSAIQHLKDGAAAEALKLTDAAREWPENLGAGKPYASELDERLEDWIASQCQLALKANDAARKMLVKIISVPAHTKGQEISDLVRAFSLKQSGRADEAKKAFRDWKSQSPDSDLAKWGAEIFAGHPTALPASLKTSDARILAALTAANIHFEPLSQE